MTYLKPLLWLCAWGTWLWLGVGLYRELPRNLRPVICRLHLDEREDALGFLADTHELVTEERSADDEPVILRVWNARSGEVIRRVVGPLDDFGPANPAFCERHGLAVGMTRPATGERAMSVGPSVLDLRTGAWKDLPEELRWHDIVFHPVKPWAAFYSRPNEDEKAGKAAVVDLRSGEIVFRWKPDWRPRPGRELEDEPFFIGESMIALPTRNEWKRFDYVSEGELELWDVPGKSKPSKVIVGLDVGSSPSVANGLIACNVVQPPPYVVDVYDVNREDFVFSDPPRHRRNPPVGGFSGGWMRPKLSSDGRSVLCGMNGKLWDVGTGRLLWTARAEDSVFGGGSETFEVAETRRLNIAGFRKTIETFATRSLQDGELIHRCWESMHGNPVSTDRLLFFDPSADGCRPLPPRIDWPLLMFCQTVLALPLVLVWGVLRWRRRWQSVLKSA